ncbi:MAG: aminotransferase class V-fold PLP-dependent enzyme [Bacteroidetes bacterium]|nr:aminotransferase class V-fold PLP-dependent enzyme [Bacteroidota bacterium]
MNSRRRFLQSTLLVSAAAISTPAELLAIVPRQGSVGKTPEWVRHARSAIPASRDPFFQTAGIAPSPSHVLDVVSNVLHYQNRGPVHPEIWPHVAATEPDLRAHFGRLFGASEHEIALTHSTSEGINIASWSRNWQKGDEGVISNQEHPANTIPWYNLATRFGVVVRRVDLSTGAALMDGMRAVVNQRTRMVSIPHVSRNNGRRISDAESAELAAFLRTRDIRFHLDGAQGPGCVPVDFRVLGCDYYSACGHKWLLGPKGTGAFFCREEMLDRTEMSWTGSHSTLSYDQDGGYILIPEARRFEFGTRALATFAGFDAALRWMEDIGFDRILGRVDELVQYAEGSWMERGHRVVSPRDGGRSGVFVLKLPASLNGLSVYNALRDHATAFTSPVDGPRDLRVAIHFFNTKQEIDATYDAIEALV